MGSMEEFNHLVIKEERLTKEDFDLAKEKIRQLCTFIKKENERRKEPDSDPDGWFSVRVDDEKQEEKMKNRLPSLFRNDLNLLLKAGWLEESYNPIINWKSLKQYRVNLIKMDKDIEEFCLYLVVASIN